MTREGWQHIHLSVLSFVFRVVANFLYFYFSLFTILGFFRTKALF